MEYAIQDVKVSENFVQAEANARAPFLRCFPKPHMISLLDYQLILCMLEFCINYRAKFAIDSNSQGNSQRPFLQMHLWELACKFHVVINAKIQALLS